MKEAVLFKNFKDKIQCTACSHYCIIDEKNRGICGVRENISSKLYLLVYGKPVSINLDPIEKKPLYHFLPLTYSLSLGTFGCNFKCSFCQNYDISQKSPSKEFYDKLKTIRPEEIITMAKENKASSISYTYNEPSIFIEYAHDIAELAKKEGIKNIYVTNGYQSKEQRDYIFSLLDALNIDLKSYKEEFYFKICKGHLKPVLETIEDCYKRGLWFEITTLLIPDLNDSKEELLSIAKFIAKIDKNIPWHISRFFPQYKMLDKAITPYENLKMAYDIGKEAGLNYVYLGNIFSEYENTFCPNCYRPVILRHGYSVENLTNKGVCPYCGFKLKGIFTI